MSGRCWVAVASADHVARGLAGGFMQVCHGKAAPLRRIRPGDRVVYYSPTTVFGQRQVLQAFTALGIVQAGEPYAFDMGGGFVPYRRDVAWQATQPAPIAGLLDHLAFTRGKRNWGYPMRLGLFDITPDDMAHIARAMLPIDSDALVDWQGDTFTLV